MISITRYTKSDESLRVSYSLCQTAMGPLICAATPKGLCFLGFVMRSDAPLSELLKIFPTAQPHASEPLDIQQALKIILNVDFAHGTLNLHLKGTDFQLKVWQQLLKIPKGQLTHYGQVAADIAHPKAVRAVGSAVGANPIAMIIPCHRVVQKNGGLGGYRWGLPLKEQLLQRERAF